LTEGGWKGFQDFVSYSKPKALWPMPMAAI
jgi:hypothetical protein